MRAVLAVIGIALLAVVLSVALQKSKDLTVNVADRDDARHHAGEADQPTSTTPAKGAKATMPPQDAPFDPPAEGKITALLSIEGHPDITLEFYPKAAPKTVAHIVGLIKSSFYDKIKVHRVVPMFVVQMGDPSTRGAHTDGSGHPIEFEDSFLQHVAGTIGLALKQAHSATGDSQFFINVNNNHSLDSNYCVFGQVVGNKDEVLAIKEGDMIRSLRIK